MADTTTEHEFGVFHARRRGNSAARRWVLMGTAATAQRGWSLALDLMAEGEVDGGDWSVRRLTQGAANAAPAGQTAVSG